MSWISLCELAELTEGKAKHVEIDGFQLAVFLHQGKPFTLDNYCPHAGGNLSGGFVDDGCAVCPWHYWAFHLDTGQLRNVPGVAVKTYPTRLLDRPDQSPLVQADLPVY